MYTVPYNKNMVNIFNNWWHSVGAVHHWKKRLKIEYGIYFNHYGTNDTVSFPSEGDFVIFMLKYS